MNKNKTLVFLLWGAHATEKKPELIDQNKHLVLTAAHPSPFSAHKGFLVVNIFLKPMITLKCTTNNLLIGRYEISY
jgi:Uracil-DNA glycosylase (EC 3.2.2.-)